MSTFLPVFDYGDGGDSDGDEPVTTTAEEATGGADESDLLEEELSAEEETEESAERDNRQDDDEEILPLGRRAALECVMELVEGHSLSPGRVKSLVVTLGKDDMESMAEERALSGKCGNPMCSNPHTHVPGKEKKRLDLRHHRAYTEFRGPSNFCSTDCDATHAALLLESLELRLKRRQQHHEQQQKPRSILKKAPEAPKARTTTTAAAAPKTKRVTAEQIMAPDIMERTADEVAEAAAKGMMSCLTNEAKAGAQDPTPRSSGSIEGYVPKAWRADDGAASTGKQKKNFKKDNAAGAAAAAASAVAVAAAEVVSGGAGGAKDKGGEGKGPSEEKEEDQKEGEEVGRGGVCGVIGSDGSDGPKLQRTCSNGRRVSFSDDADALSTSTSTPAAAAPRAAAPPSAAPPAPVVAASAERPPLPPHCPPREQQQQRQGSVAEAGPSGAGPSGAFNYSVPPPSIFEGITNRSSDAAPAKESPAGRGLSFASCARVEYEDHQGAEERSQHGVQSTGGAEPSPPSAAFAGAAAASASASASAAPPPGKGGGSDQTNTAPAAARKFKPNVPPSGGGRRRPVRPINVKWNPRAPSAAAPEGGGDGSGDKEEEEEEEDIKALLEGMGVGDDEDDDLDLDGGIFSPVADPVQLSSFGVMHTTICNWVTASSQRFLAADQPPEDQQAAPGWTGVRDSLKVQLSRQVGSVLQALLPPGSSQQQQQGGSGISRHGIEARVDELLDTFYTCDPLPAFRVKDWRLLTAIILKALSNRRVPAAKSLFSLEEDGSTQALQRFVLACESGLEEFELLHELMYPY